MQAYSNVRLYGRYVDLSLRAQMQYRASFLLKASAHFLLTFIEFLGFVALFQRFRQVRGWTLAEMGIFYGMISVAFAIAEAVPRGFDMFGKMIRQGDFDRVLLRPRSPTLQILGQEVQLMRVGRLSQGVLVLLWATWRLGVRWSLAKTGLLLFAIGGGACLFSGLFVLQAAMCFWTIESIEIINCTTYGGVEAAQFPLTLYHPWLRRFFTFVVPLATINYFPAHAILGRGDPLGSTRVMQYLSPIAGPIFLLLCVQLWRLGIRRYQSTGS